MYFSRDCMPKRKPDGKGVIVHRIEFQEKERELLELFLVANASNKLIDSAFPPLVNLIQTISDPIKFYGFLTLLEVAGVIDTPVPTLGDSTDEAAAAVIAIKDWLGFDTAYRENSAANQMTQEILLIQATENQVETERLARETGEAYRQGDVSYEDMRAAQDKLNQAQDAKFRAERSAERWEFKFQFENGRAPTRQEVAEAKGDGTYYPISTQSAIFNVVRTLFMR